MSSFVHLESDSPIIITQTTHTLQNYYIIALFEYIMSERKLTEFTELKVKVIILMKIDT